MNVEHRDGCVERSEATLVSGRDLKVLATVFEEEHEGSGIGVKTGGMERCLTVGVADV